MGPVYITAVLKAKQGNEQRLYEALLKVAAPSRDEAGCQEYRLHQSTEDSSVFVLYENWRDEGALKSHIESQHYGEYRSSIEPLVEKREVYRLGKIS
jgi:quinol monooxygenase YgiN